MRYLISVIFLISLQVSASQLDFSKLRFITVDESPANFINEQGELVGYSVDVIKRLQQALELDTQIELMPEARAMHTLNHKPDIVMFSISRTDKREANYHWLAHVLTKRWILYSKFDVHFDNASLEKTLLVRTVGVVRGDVREGWLKKHYSSQANTVSLLNYYTGVEMLLKDRIDLLFYESYGMYGTLEKLGYHRNEIKPQFVANSSDVYIVLSKNGTSELMAQVLQRQLQQIQESPWYQEHTESWLNELNKSGSGDAWVYNKVLQY